MFLVLRPLGHRKCSENGSPLGVAASAPHKVLAGYRIENGGEGGDSQNLRPEGSGFSAGCRPGQSSLLPFHDMLHTLQVPTCCLGRQKCGLRVQVAKDKS